MFDIGFWELFLIFMLLLFVVGPDKLPVVAGFLGRWFGKIQRYFFELKDSIQKETAEPSNEINKLVDDQKSHMDRIQEEITKAKEDDQPK
jgi:sec-independent protein translocase protein TatB